MSDIVQPSPTLHGDRPAAASRQALLDRRELTFIAVERTRMPMVVTDARLPDGPIVLANQAFLQLTGYGADEVLGRNCRFMQGEGTSAVAIAEIRAGIAEGREVNVELLNYRKDGSSFWNQLHLSPIHDDDGQLLYYFGSQVDVTEYRKVQSLEAVEHRLLREVDHRAMNVLAIVDGIVRLSRADNAAEYAASVQRRVHALAQAHAMLAESGWAETPLDRLIRLQVEPYGDRRIALDGPEFAVTPNLVQPLALVLHELVANAVVHGALSGPEGRLQLHWRTGADGKRLELRWEETGGPPPREVHSPGFGATIIKAIVERQLQGQYRTDWSPDGLKATLEIPLPPPQQSAFAA